MAKEYIIREGKYYEQDGEDERELSADEVAQLNLVPEDDDSPTAGRSGGVDTSTTESTSTTDRVTDSTKRNIYLKDMPGWDDYSKEYVQDALEGALALSPKTADEIRKKRLKEQENKRKSANLFNALMVAGDILGASIGGNVQKHDFVKGKEYADKRDKYEELYKAEDTAAAIAARKALQDAKKDLNTIGYRVVGTETHNNYAPVTTKKVSVTKKPTPIRTTSSRGGGSTKKPPKVTSFYLPSVNGGRAEFEINDTDKEALQAYAQAVYSSIQSMAERDGTQAEEAAEQLVHLEGFINSNGEIKDPSAFFQNVTHIYSTDGTRAARERLLDKSTQVVRKDGKVTRVKGRMTEIKPTTRPNQRHKHKRKRKPQQPMLLPVDTTKMTRSELRAWKKEQEEKNKNYDGVVR